MLGTWVAALAMIGTLVIAKVALNTWKEQEIMKSKKDFKMALLEMKFALVWLPEEINFDQLMAGRNLLYPINKEGNSPIPLDEQIFYKSYAGEFEKFENAMQKSWQYWSACEGLFKGSHVEELWAVLLGAHNEYTHGLEKQSKLLAPLNALLKEEMYFKTKN